MTAQEHVPNTNLIPGSKFYKKETVHCVLGRSQFINKIYNIYSKNQTLQQQQKSNPNKAKI